MHLPNGKTTRSTNVYVRAWRKLGNEVVKFFPGYTVVAYDSGLTLHKYEKNRFNETVVADRLNLNMPAIKALCASQIVPFLHLRRWGRVKPNEEPRWLKPNEKPYTR